MTDLKDKMTNSTMINSLKKLTMRSKVDFNSKYKKLSNSLNKINSRNKFTKNNNQIKKMRLKRQIKRRRKKRLLQIKAIKLIKKCFRK
jgi:hypothetical protein